MREHGFDGLLVAGFRSREMYETYISDDYNEGCVLFPLEGDPVVITWAHLRVMRARWSQERGANLWVADYRVATSGAGVAEVLAEKHLAHGSLGVVGLKSQAPTEIYGAIPANFWIELTAALPQALGGYLRGVQPPDAGQERRGAGAGALRGARRRGRLPRSSSGGAGRRRGGGVRRGDARMLRHGIGCAIR